MSAVGWSVEIWGDGEGIRVYADAEKDGNEIAAEHLIVGERLGEVSGEVERMYQQHESRQPDQSDKEAVLMSKIVGPDAYQLFIGHFDRDKMILFCRRVLAMLEASDTGN